MSENVKKIKASLACVCPRKGSEICNTVDCPIFQEFSSAASLLDYKRLGMNKIFIQLKLGVCKDE